MKARYLLWYGLILLVCLSVLFGGCTSFLAPSPPPATPFPIVPTWTALPPQTQPTSSTLPTLADVVSKVRPSVVAIDVEVVTSDIFNQPRTQKGAGSGWIIDSNGLIVTNNHVVEGAKNITATLYDGRVLTAESTSTDPLTDLAVIKVNATGLPAVTIGDASKLRVGDWVMAIGNPLGEGISATQGIVSRLGVQVAAAPGQTLYDLIETTAAINPGNSGGPLVNLTGEVVGMTSLKIAAVGIEGMGYAINIRGAIPIIQQLVNAGHVVRPFLGVTVATIDPATAQRLGLKADKGALVTQIASGSPADQAGIRINDAIAGFEDKSITSSGDLRQAVISSQIGQTVKITLWRGDTQITVNATLAQAPG